MDMNNIVWTGVDVWCLWKLNKFCQFILDTFDEIYITIGVNEMWCDRVWLEFQMSFDELINYEKSQIDALTNAE